ncbi:hypothetical protein Q0601_09050 [Paracoccus onubensis]|uniref:hypothetical protein n=1 Tax=Paracoccus onubensis TaxID=1675788 RepID=UPI00272F158A|nr:hypothetical protein [Paracoccus onubensis]MDP0927315.1 hypothetical protein [Paracoccus onubensis]
MGYRPAQLRQPGYPPDCERNIPAQRDLGDTVLHGPSRPVQARTVAICTKPGNQNIDIPTGNVANLTYCRSVLQDDLSVRVTNPDRPGCRLDLASGDGKRPALEDTS